MAFEVAADLDEIEVGETLVVDDTVVCAAHAATFDLTSGRSVGVPAVRPIAVHACKIEDGCVLVDLLQQLDDAGPQEPARHATG